LPGCRKWAGIRKTYNAIQIHAMCFHKTNTGVQDKSRVFQWRLFGTLYEWSPLEWRHFGALLFENTCKELLTKWNVFRNDWVFNNEIKSPVCFITALILFLKVLSFLVYVQFTNSYLLANGLNHFSLCCFWYNDLVFCMEVKILVYILLPKWQISSHLVLLSSSNTNVIALKPLFKRH
jgi:hypothetical protein